MSSSSAERRPPARSRCRSRATRSSRKQRPRRVISSAPSRSTPLFDAVDARIREAVARVAATEPDPLDPFRGLYIADEGALRTAADGPPPHAAGALADVTAELGLGPLDGALLAVCAAPELDARYGRLLAYLHDDVTRRLPTPRLATRLL